MNNKLIRCIGVATLSVRDLTGTTRLVCARHDGLYIFPFKDTP